MTDRRGEDGLTGTGFFLHPPPQEGREMMPEDSRSPACFEAEDFLNWGNKVVISEKFGEV